MKGKIRRNCYYTSPQKKEKKEDRFEVLATEKGRRQGGGKKTSLIRL